MTVAACPAAPSRAGHDDDLDSRAMEQAALSRAGDLAALDRENLTEEIERLGRSEFNSLVSAWRVVLPMPKFDHRPTRATRSRAPSIAGHRDNAADVLRDHPGLKSRFGEALDRVYRKARVEAARETGLPPSGPPERRPSTREAMLARPFPIDPVSPSA
ncbi:DUF29 domain-containing protein [Methylobacterium sp. ID0610]|uniref:DUF29 domain-containing protein n=1 Tax=Methylobacterium carpenticola TaxID=3344827 RepID=UPI0036BF954C